LLVQRLTGIGGEGITPEGLSLAAMAMVLALCVRWLVIRIMNGYLKRLVDMTQTNYDNKVHAALKRSIGYFIFLGGLFLAFSCLDLPHQPVDWNDLVWRVLNTLFLVSAGLLAYRVIEITLSFLAEKHGAGHKSLLDQQFLPLLRDVAKVALILFVVVAVAQNWGYSPAGILAGVGLGGLAMAFAAQDTVANVFGSFVVFADRPYKIGDWIQLAGIEGTVEQIGIRSTRIRMFDKALVSVPNKIVTNESIYNYSEMPVRRISLNVALALTCEPEQILAVVQDIRELLRTHPGIDQEYWVSSFSELSAYSLDVLVYCFTRSTVWEEYLDVRQDLLLRILAICRTHQAEIAFPTSTVYYRHPQDATGLPSASQDRGRGVPLPEKFAPNPQSAPQVDDKTYGMEHNRAEEG
jgi:MscS family membrane protein